MILLFVGMAWVCPSRYTLIRAVTFTNFSVLHTAPNYTHTHNTVHYHALYHHSQWRTGPDQTQYVWEGIHCLSYNECPPKRIVSNPVPYATDCINTALLPRAGGKKEMGRAQRLDGGILK